jgi:hypothetical protein
MKIPVKIVTANDQATAGLADARMLRPLRDEVVRVPDDLAANSVCGGVLPITQAEYDKVKA